MLETLYGPVPTKLSSLNAATESKLGKGLNESASKNLRLLSSKTSTFTSGTLRLISDALTGLPSDHFWSFFILNLYSFASAVASQLSTSPEESGIPFSLIPTNLVVVKLLTTSGKFFSSYVPTTHSTT